MKKFDGFSLVELLVTMSMLSMIIFLGSSSYALFSKGWDGKLGDFDSTLRSAKSMILVQSVLDNLVPYLAYDINGFPGIYFEGNRNGFVGVSSNSIYQDQRLTVVRLSTRQKPDFSFDVFYEEWPIGRDSIIPVAWPLEFSSPILLFESVKNPLFEYYGWQSLIDKNSNGEGLPPPPQWMSNYDAFKGGAAPLKALFSFDGAKGKLNILSNLTTERPGFVSRYKVKQPGWFGTDSDFGVPSDDDRGVDDCYC